MADDTTLNKAHWTIEGFRQRMTTAEWRKILLGERDTIAFKGNVRKLVGKNLGAGVVEVSKRPRVKTETSMEGTP